MTTLYIPLDNETCLLESIWLGTAGKLLESEQSTWCLLQGQKPLCDPCALQWLDHNFFGTTHNNWKIAGLCSNISDGGEVKGFFIASELEDQASLCLCFVKLFSSGPRSREETDIINHMKPVYPLRCGPWLSGDWCASEWTNLFHLSNLKVPLEFSLWVLLHEQCGVPLGNSVAGMGLLTVRMEIWAELEWMLSLEGCPKRGWVMLFHDEGVLHRALHHAPISPVPMCYISFVAALCCKFTFQRRHF